MVKRTKGNKSINKSLIKLDVGCGPKKLPGYLGVDIEAISGVDYVVDLDSQLLPFKDNTVDEIYCSHFMEHVEDPVKILREFYRVLKNNGTLIIIVPHYKNPYSYHFTHKTYWSTYAFEQQYIDYYIKEKLVLLTKQVRIVTPWRILDAPLTYICNLNLSLYERFLSIFIQAWDIKFVLYKDVDKKDFLQI